MKASTQKVLVKISDVYMMNVRYYYDTTTTYIFIHDVEGDKDHDKIRYFEFDTLSQMEDMLWEYAYGNRWDCCYTVKEVRQMIASGRLIKCPK